ncbi:MAG: DUF6261 family protein [Alistipes sp.]|nr:DUF6261 family protein [Alistipes sp.]
MSRKGSLGLRFIPGITELDRRNVAVEKLMESRFDEGAGQSPPAMKEARAGVDAAYGALADMLFAQGLVASLGTDATLTAKYNEVVARWNEVIDRTENIVARRRSGTKKEEEAEKPIEN